MRQRWFVLWELTKRELNRKYARSYFGILWSCFYPLMRMALVVFLFSTVFSKNIPKYPAYYFVAYLIFEFFATATQTSLTTLKDNRNLLIKSKLPREYFVMSRVLTAFVNFLLGCIPFILVLIFYRAKITIHYIWIPFVTFFLFLFTVGMSYMVSIWFVFQRDARNIYSNLVMILRFFVAMFFSVDHVSEGVKQVIVYNPVYAYIKVMREFVLYGNSVDRFYIIQAVAWGIGTYLVGKRVFKNYENYVVERL